MLNTKKLLYILPDVAYVAELLPTKKEHSFSVQSFRQINGEFMADETLLADHVEKLMAKLEPDEYHLVLPDFLFTNTILEINETADTKVKQHIEEEVLPSLKIDKDSYHWTTFTLTQLQKVTKVQLSAIEKSVLSPVKTAATTHNVKIAAISPLSWTLKAVISLEPSISIVQLGGQLYLAQHYIGVDQAATSSVESLDQLVETVKTLKGSEPSIQTVYLLTNSLVESQLKDQLSDTLPLQQLSQEDEKASDMPSYVKAIIETTSKTLDISDFPVPIFSLEGVAAMAGESSSEKPVAAVAAEPMEKASEPEDIEDSAEEVEDEAATESDVDANPDTELELDELPAALPAAAATLDLPAPNKPLLLESSDEPELPATVADATESEDIEESTEKPEALTAEPEKEEVKSEEPEAKPELKSQLDIEPEESDTTSDESTSRKTAELAQFAASSAMSDFTATPATPQRPVLKNRSNVGNMVKMIFITVAVLCVTVAVGVGVGLGLLSFSNRQAGTPSPSPSPTIVAATTPTPIPSPSPVAEVDRSTIKVLVVNATSVAGKAGTIKSDLEKAGFTGVKTGNAKGEYSSGSYALMTEANPALLEILTKDTGLTLEHQTDQKTEDPQSSYDVVIVFAEEAN